MVLYKESLDSRPQHLQDEISVLLSSQDRSSPLADRAACQTAFKREGKIRDELNKLSKATKKSEDPNLIYGRDFEDDLIELKQVVNEMGEITFRGQVVSFDTREIRNEKTIIMFAVTDFTDTIMVKMFGYIQSIQCEVSRSSLIIHQNA